MIKIRIRKANNGYIIKFYRGFWDMFVCRSVALNKDQVVTIIQEQLEKSFIDFVREEEV